MKHVQGRGEVHRGFWLEDLREIENLVNLRTDTRIFLKLNIKMDLQEIG